MSILAAYPAAALGYWAYVYFFENPFKQKQGVFEWQSILDRASVQECGRFWVFALIISFIRTNHSEKYTHSLFDFSKSLRYNQTDINERSNPKWLTSTLTICIAKNCLASSFEQVETLFVLGAEKAEDHFREHRLSAWSLWIWWHRLHTAGGFLS